MSGFTSAEVKLRTLAAMNATLIADLGSSLPPTFRWFNRQLQQNVVAEVTPGTCVRVTRTSTLRPSNMGGIMNLTAIRFQIDVLDLASETARSVANDVINFLGTINLCSNGQFSSPYVGPSQNPNFLLNQRAGMIPNPQNPNGPVYVETLDVRIYNREDLSIS